MERDRAMDEAEARRTRRRASGVSAVKPARPLDEFDLRLRRSIVAAFVGGSFAHFIVVNAIPGHAYGGFFFANAMVLLGLVSALLIPYLPWGRYGRDLFSVVLLYGAVLIAGLIYSTGGPDSPFVSTFLLITISAGLYHTTRIALVIAVACAALGFLPALYATPRDDFWVQQAVLAASALAAVAFHRLMLPEILRRARAEQGLQEDLRETRELRDELARANALLAQQARTDPLTGLLNHGAIIARADGALSGALAAGEALSLLFFDIDRFKRINDTYGHQAGDAILAGVARRVAVALRQDDHLGRYGGEEFLIVLPQTGPQEATALAERLRAAVAAEPFALPDATPVRVTISIGVATVDAHTTTRAGLLQAADLALYQAKAGGRDRVCSLPVAA